MEVLQAVRLDRLDRRVLVQVEEQVGMVPTGPRPMLFPAAAEEEEARSPTVSMTAALEARVVFTGLEEAGVAHVVPSAPAARAAMALRASSW